MDEYKQNKMGRCSSINSVHEEHSLQQKNRNESFFGMKPRLGLANLNLDKEVTDEIWTEEQLNEVLEIEEAPIEYQIEAPGLRNVINLVQDQVSTLAEGELADDIDGGSEECHLCAANGELCGLCLRKSKIVEMREMAKKRQNLKADKMLEQSNKRFKPAEEGENVNVPTPEVDRGCLDPSNFTAVVQEHESETKLYTLGTRAGTLNTRFSRNQFNLMNQKFLTTADVPEDVTLSVREAARLHSNAGGQGFFKCLCQTACLTKNANASGTLSSAILAVIKIVVARIMTMP